MVMGNRRKEDSRRNPGFGRDFMTGRDFMAGREGADSQSADRNQAEDRKQSEYRKKTDRKPQKSVRDCALSLLEYGDRTEKELARKLKDREYSPEEIGEALGFLKEYHYIDDEAYAGKYVRTCSSRKSIRQIRCDLEQKGVAREFIDAALEQNQVDEEVQIRAFLEKKGYRSGERMDPDAYRKVTAALFRRGFSYEAVRQVTARMAEETE